MGDRLDPLEEIKRTWALLTRRERIEFLSWLSTAPDCQRPEAPRHFDPPPTVKLDGEGER